MSKLLASIKELLSSDGTDITGISSTSKQNNKNGDNTININNFGGIAIIVVLAIIVLIAYNVTCMFGNHTYGDYSTTVTATCTAEGEEVRTCSKCGDEETKTIPATGHNPETILAVEATCEKNGSTEGLKCSGCGEILQAPETIPATGHKWEWNSDYGMYVCKNCGTKVDDIM